MNRFFFFLSALALFAGCATTKNSASSPSQMWPLARGAMSSSTFAVPVYRSWPERPYRIIASAQFQKSVGDWRALDTAFAAQTAKDENGDAVVLHFPGEFSVGRQSDLAANNIAFSPTGATALVIKWKTPDELADEKRAWDDFCVRFKAAHPDFEVSNEFLEMAAGYAAYLGLDLSLAPDSARLNGDLNKVCRSSSTWLYRGILHVNTQKTSYTDSIYGIATFTEIEGKASIVSSRGKAALSFHGEVQDGRINGQLEVTSGALICPMNAQGVVVPHKISLDSHGQTTADVVRGSLTFAR